MSNPTSAGSADTRLHSDTATMPTARVAGCTDKSDNLTRDSLCRPVCPVQCADRTRDTDSDT
eukprot:5600167-Prymnesium_polylepis.1